MKSTFIETRVLSTIALLIWVRMRPSFGQFTTPANIIIRVENESSCKKQLINLVYIIIQFLQKNNLQRNKEQRDNEIIYHGLNKFVQNLLEAE